MFNSKKLLASSGYRVDFTGTLAACARDFLDHRTFAERNRECLTVKFPWLGLELHVVEFRIVIRITRRASRDKFPGDIIYTVLLVIIIMGPGQANRNLAIVRVFRGRGKTPIRQNSPYAQKRKSHYPAVVSPQVLQTVT